MEEKKKVKQSVKFLVNKAETPDEINRRLELLHQRVLADEWGVHETYVCLIFQGQRLPSPYIKKLARKIRATEQDLREVLSDRACLLTEQKQQSVA